MKRFLPDINVWIALSFDSHPHHKHALKWFIETPDSIVGFCRTTQQGFLRIATNRKAMADDALTLPAAWHAFDAILLDPRVTFFGEPMNIECHWRIFTGNQEFSSKIWTDAYLAAFACAADLQIVTFDHGFSRYAELDVTCLSP